MTNDRIQIAFSLPEPHTRTLEPEDYRSLLYLDAGVEIVEQSGITTLYPWAAIHSLRKIRVGGGDEAIIASDGQVLDMVMPDPTVAERGTARERSIA